MLWEEDDWLASREGERIGATSFPSPRSFTYSQRSLTLARPLARARLALALAIFVFSITPLRSGQIELALSSQSQFIYTKITPMWDA